MADDETTPSRRDEPELDALRSLVGGGPAEEVTWEEPPAGLWERIAAELDVPVAGPAEHPGEVDLPAAGPAEHPGEVDLLAAGPAEQQDEPGVPGDRRGPAQRQGEPGVPGDRSGPAEPGDTATPPDPSRPGAGAAPGSRPPTELDRRRRRRAVPWLVGAAAAVVLLVVGVAVLVDRSPSSDVVASVQLDRLGSAGSGAAELVEQDGRYRLRVDTADLDPGDGFLEVWVIDSDVSKLVSLGPVRDDGTYDLPPDLDPRQFPVVDVSVEPLDGDPAHSGDSVLRGQLTF